MGEDIFFMTEILIPYRGQSLKGEGISEEQKAREEVQRRAACIQLLNGAIEDGERKAMQQGKIPKTKVYKNYSNEAKFYFEDNELDYWKALKAYKEDLDHEMQHFAQEKELKKKNKKKGRGVKVNGMDDQIGNTGCN